MGKTRVTLSLETEALNLLLDYSEGPRKLGELLTRLLYEHHARQQMDATQVAAELRRLADVLERTS
jgi:hypothetical protein